jgi:transcriptional regulator with XRE-family HTH domain
MVDVNGKIVKRLRKEAKMTQEKLSEVADISVSTLKKIEATPESACYDLRSEPAKKLARALDVPIKALSDEKAYRIGSSTNDLNYELIALRYGVSQEWLHEYAPLMFAVLAEEATVHLKSIAEKIDSHLDDLLKISGLVGDRFQESIIDARNNRTIASSLAIKDMLADDQSKIAMQDVLHPLLDNDPDDSPESPKLSNDYQAIPAVLQYLIHKGRHWDTDRDGMGFPDVLDSHNDADFGQITVSSSSYGVYDGCSPPLIASISALERLIAGKSGLNWNDLTFGGNPNRLLWAFIDGQVKVADIPPELMSDDPETFTRRSEWLKEKVARIDDSKVDHTFLL